MRLFTYQVHMTFYKQTLNLNIFFILKVIKADECLVSLSFKPRAHFIVGAHNFINQTAHQSQQ